MAAAVETLTEEEQAALRAEIDRHSISTVADKLGIHEQTVRNAAGGFTVQRGTARFVRQYLGTSKKVRL